MKAETPTNEDLDKYEAWNKAGLAQINELEMRRKIGEWYATNLTSKEIGALLNSGHKFDFTEDQVRVTTATPEESPFPFTEYGKTVTLSPNDDVKPAGFKSKSERVKDGNKLPDPDDVFKQMAKDLKDLVDQACKDDPLFAERVDAYRSKREFLWLSILPFGTAILLSVILIISFIERHFV